ncbi:hypothetical protein [uncultured Methylobacterium sp.]|uniref:hypothetical protein n=1 Tax=uncultured Methylobacterium sp. TaxID=157278 RepID=UPI002598CB05|nr:hypothetical protein [uncultured Methylobacterium sp.]
MAETAGAVPRASDRKDGSSPGPGLVRRIRDGIRPDGRAGLLTYGEVAQSGGAAFADTGLRDTMNILWRSP